LDWHDALRDLLGRGFATLAMTHALSTPGSSSTRSPASIGERWCLAVRGKGCARAGSRLRPGIGSINVAAAMAVACDILQRC
jgi:hypothetical protein